ncbi:MAG TPA: response regulator [Pirellulales bacterium]|nr:response regulator [Pirellulales bacterium]
MSSKLVPIEPKATGRLRILLVEDSFDVAEPLVKQLRQAGHDCRLATSASEALALAPYYRPGIVLIDIGLPDMDGWELARRLPGGSLLIAVTARGEADDFERSRAAGIGYHLVKPAFQKQLHELLARLDCPPSDRGPF